MVAPLRPLITPLTCVPCAAARLHSNRSAAEARVNLSEILWILRACNFIVRSPKAVFAVRRETSWREEEIPLSKVTDQEVRLRRGEQQKLVGIRCNGAVPATKLSVRGAFERVPDSAAGLSFSF